MQSGMDIVVWILCLVFWWLTVLKLQFEYVDLSWWWHVNHFSIFSGEDEEVVVYQDSQVTQEMLEEQLVRLLTREVLDLLSKYFYPPPPFSNHDLW